MQSQKFALAGMLEILSNNWKLLLWLLLPFIILDALILILEAVAISKMDSWLTVETSKVAERNSVRISSVIEWLRLSLIGIATFRVINSQVLPEATRVGPSFLFFWIAIAFLFSLSVLVIDEWHVQLRFQSGTLSGESLRGIWLVSIYFQILLFYVSTRFWFGLLMASRTEGISILNVWRVTSIWQSLSFFIQLFLLKLIVDNVLIKVLSFFPLIAPFWFVPNELDEYRYFVGQGTRILNDALSLYFYISFLLAIDQLMRSTKPRTLG